MGNCCFTTGPNEVMVKSGCCISPSQMIVGGCVCIWPCCQIIQRLSLNTMTLSIESAQVYSKQGVSISVIGVAQVKVCAKSDALLYTACQLFLDKSEHQVLEIARETMEGHQRAIIGKLTVEEILRDKQKFSDAVFEVASTDLINMGISVVSYTLKDIKDSNGYLQALGLSRTAQAKRDARMGEAEAKRDAGIRSATAEWKEKAVKFENDIEIAKAEKDYHLKAAAYAKEVTTRKADSDLSHDLQSAKTKQEIMAEEMQIQVVERSQMTLLQEQEITRKERELESTVRKPADAERFRLEKIAEADNRRLILEAKAKSEAIEMKGLAEAYAIEAKAKAEAEQMAKKAEAWKEYGGAAMTEMMLDVLPKVAAEVAAPLSQTNRVVMVSSGDSAVGVERLTSEVLQVVESMPRVIESMTGVDIISTMKS